MIRKFFAILRELFQNPKSILRVLNPSESESKKYISNKYQLSNGLPLVDIEEVVGKIQNDKIIFHTFLDGGSMPTDLILLQKLAKKFPQGKYLEIGTWRGESVVNVAPFVKEAITLNLPDSEILRRGGSKEYLNQGGMFIPQKSNIVQIKADSATFDFTPFYKSIDLVFVDGDHHYTSVKKDTETAFKLLANANSMIVWHDYGFNPEAVRWEVLQAILDGTPPEHRASLFHVSNTKSAIFSSTKYKSGLLQFGLKPLKVFNVTLESKDLVSE